MSEKVTITKIGGAVEAQPSKKTHKVIPRSILKTSKVRPTSDPSKAPPVNKIMRKHTIRLLTDKGYKRHRKTLRRKISKLSDEKIKEIAKKGGLLKNPNTPIQVLREMVEGGAIAGFLSLQ
jgi:predicted type IV restriction endonuclease